MTLDAWRFSTRARKSAVLYRGLGRTKFIGLSGAGRTGRWDSPGSFQASDVDVLQVPVRRPATEPTTLNQWRNIVLCYVPAFVRLMAATVSTPADVVHVTGSPLALLGLIHRLRFRSRLVLDIQERPGAVSSRGSVTAVFRPVERSLLRALAAFVDLAVVVTTADVGTARELGFKNVALVRNAPVKGWRAHYAPPPRRKNGEATLAAVGSIFEGRAYEVMLRALAAPPARNRVRLRIYGPGRPEYVASLRDLTDSLGVADNVDWMGPVASSEVSAAYLAAHAGLALYETSDPGNDGLSNKILECVATGRPVVAGDLPENRRFIDESHAGWLTDVHVDALANAFAAVADTTVEELEALSLLCRQHGDGWLNWETEFAPVLDFVRTR